MSALRRSLLAIGLTALVGLADWFSHANIAATLAYLLPISIVGWGMSKAATLVAAAVCSGMWLTIDVKTSTEATPMALVIINAIVLATVLQLFGQLLATLKSQLDHERKLARTDPLTQVHNRRAFWNAATRELARSRRQGTSFSLAYIDVDGFKAVNDRFGHHAGDQLLRGIAQELQQELRELDMVARLGGDEFVLLLPDTGEIGAGKVIDRVKKSLQAAVWRRSFDIDFSIGVLTVIDPPSSVEELVSGADELMYQVKRTGRGLILHDAIRVNAALPVTNIASVRMPDPRIAN
jgi:diguanylate cyclase (GGDEF)-like protein